MINLITSFYFSKISHHAITDRNKEIQTCLNKNLENNLIKKIHLFIDDEIALKYIKKLKNPKINIISIGKQPLYSDLFSYAIKNLKDEICMISNSDIYLHECDINILNKINEPDTIFSLTRYEHDLSCPLIDVYGGSHDCFIFKSPLNLDLLNHIAHPQNLWNSEGVVLYELKKINMNIYNPCYQIKIVHLHKSEIRENDRYTYSNERRCLINPILL
jgi:hypothetical protein